MLGNLKCKRILRAHVCLISFLIGLMPRVGLASDDQYEREARREFSSLSSREIVNADYLDDFIYRYFGTMQANIAFTLRTQIVRSSFSIEDYNNFLSLYGDTTAGRIALFEAFELYQQHDNVPSYLDFMERYPNSPEALLAKTRVHYLLFSFAETIYKSSVSDKEKIQALDDFMELNYDAPQVPAALMLATLLEVKKEEQNRCYVEKIAKDSKYEGLNTLRSGFSQLIKNELPAYEIISGAAIAFASLLLILPGFATDVIGFLLIFPLTRKLIFGKYVSKFKNETKTKKTYIEGEFEDIEEDKNDQEL